MTDARWRAEFVESLQQLGNPDAQREAWVDLKRPHFPAPEELICQVFDDSGIDDLLSRGPVFSSEADAVLKELSSAAGELPLSGLADILADANWTRIVALARRALLAVRGDA